MFTALPALWAAVKVLDPRKYFILALIVFALGSAGTAFVYRANYRTEQLRAAQSQIDLKAAIAALDAYKAEATATIDALSTASRQKEAIHTDRAERREKVIRTPRAQDAPVAPVLLNTINGLRKDGSTFSDPRAPR